MGIAVSVIICTYNGASRLPEVFRYLLAQVFNKHWEIVVVDNNSIDNTKGVCDDFSYSFKDRVQFKYLFEGEQGLIYARLAGVRASLGSIIVFCDDDNYLYPTYLNEVFSFLEKNKDADVIGGNVIAISDIEFPEWFEDYKYAYACGLRYPDCKRLCYGEYLWGAGISVRRKVADVVFDVNFPFLLSGRKGMLLSSGEDDEICLRAFIAGFGLYYNPSLILHHFISANRLNTEYRDNLLRGFTMQAKVVGAYTRYLDCMLRRQKFLLLRKLLAYFYYLFTGNSTQLGHAGDYLYFLTGLRKFRTGENFAVANFGANYLDSSFRID